jgi:hypothetical protein
LRTVRLPGEKPTKARLSCHREILHAGSETPDLANQRNAVLPSPKAPPGNVLPSRSGLGELTALQGVLLNSSPISVSEQPSGMSVTAAHGIVAQ